MRRTISTSIRARLAGISLIAGALLITEAIRHGAATHAAAGVALIVVGTTTRALRIVERVISDTSREREQLRREQQAARTEHMKYVVARAIVDREAENLCKQLAKNERETAERIATGLDALQAQLADERAELFAEVEDRKTALKREGFLLGLDAGTRGIALEPLHTQQGAVVIPFHPPTIGSTATTAGKGGQLSQ